jgi:hypothetical protein
VLLVEDEIVTVRAFEIMLIGKGTGLFYVLKHRMEKLLFSCCKMFNLI